VPAFVSALCGTPAGVGSRESASHQLGDPHSPGTPNIELVIGRSCPADGARCSVFARAPAALPGDGGVHGGRDGSGICTFVVISSTR
jgi:hypothetical protein